MRAAAICRRAAAAIALCAASAAAPAAEHGAIVALLQAPNAAAVNDCVFFTLQGVAAADAALSPTPWFSVPKAHQGFREILVTLHLSKLLNKTVYVGTTGATACGGYPAVNYVYY